MTAGVPSEALSIASVGKVLLLVEAARQTAEGTLDPAEILRRTREDVAHGSGLWQHLAIEALPAADVAALVAAFSDNLATNVLLRRIGLEDVNQTAARLGLQKTRLHDQVRDKRRPEHPDALARGSATELSSLLSSAARRELISEVVSDQLLHWMSLNANGTMVSASWNLDPLEHFEPTRNLRIANKTGTDTGVRCDIGMASVVRGRAIAYAVVANWNEAARDARDDVLEAMRAFGADLKAILEE